MSQAAGQLCEAEMRKVCERGHALDWRPWYRVTAPILGHCLCGAPYHRETRGPAPLDRRGLALAGDALAAERPEVDLDAERLAKVVIRTYLNEAAPTELRA